MPSHSNPTALVSVDDPKISMDKDIEATQDDREYLTNTSVRSFGWEGVTVNVKDRKTKRPKTLVQSINGFVTAGEMLAIMGPSGSGKTTLLNVLAHRDVLTKASVDGSMYINSTPTVLRDFRRISSYVEQDDALIGSLTIRETMSFAARLSLPGSVGKVDRNRRIDALIAAFGLREQADDLVGTPIRKGIGGGQKRRVSVASHLITSPKVLFLDEPTSGLDSQAAFEVISFVKQVAKAHNIIVVASIHQPSTATFNLFDSLLLLSSGQAVYNGSVDGVCEYFSSIGYEMPHYMNPAEYVIELANTDFLRDREKAAQQLVQIQTAWSNSNGANTLVDTIKREIGSPAGEVTVMHHSASPWTILLTLLHRSYIKSYRDVLAYGIRIAMYLGLAIMMGTVWVRLAPHQDNIEYFQNSIFFGTCFMSFMAVAYVPAYIEDRNLFIKERENGLYGPTSFMVANFVTGILPLFLIAISFSLIDYWLSNFRPAADGFWLFVMWLFLDLLAAEGLVVLVTNIIPVFIAALASVAFVNGLWMIVEGYMVRPNHLNPFWRYVFHYIDYLAYVFQGMMVNEFGKRTYACQRLPGGGCQCLYSSPLEDQCLIAGTAVLDGYGYRTDRTGLWVGILIAIIFTYRLLAWGLLYVIRH